MPDAAIPSLRTASPPPRTGASERTSTMESATMRPGQRRRSSTPALMAIGAAALALDLSTAPVRAQDNDRNHGRQEHRHYVSHSRDYRLHAYAQPSYVYAPPPVYYAPPP